MANTNPYVTVDDLEAGEHAPALDNYTWIITSFETEPFFVKADGIDDKSLVEDTDDIPNPFNFFFTVQDAGNPIPENFNTDAGEAIKKTASGFATANKSVMARMAALEVTKQISNGIKDTKYDDDYYFNRLNYGNFIWKGSDIEFISGVGALFTPGQWVYVDALGAVKKEDGKDDDTGGGVNLTLDPEEAEYPFVMDGSFSLVVNPVKPANGTLGTSENEDGEIEFEFGDITASFVDAHTLLVEIAGGDEVRTEINLGAARATEGSPFLATMGPGEPMALTFYKCWNGVCVSCGYQKANELRFTNTTVAHKYNGASILAILEDDEILVPKKLIGEDAQELPDFVEIPDTYKSRSFIVSFGKNIGLTVRGLKLQFAFVPYAHAPMCKFVNGNTFNADNDASKYTHDLTVLFAENKAGYKLDKPTPEFVKDDENGVKWGLVRYVMTYSGGEWPRNTSEIMGYLYRTREHRNKVLRNGNGKFTFTGQRLEAQGDGGSWMKYITSVSVNITLNGSSGSIEVDKIGYGGEDGMPKQSIGGIKLTASGGNDTHAGTIFAGIALGIGMNTSGEDATYTIPLVGLERKLSDLVLINPPFMDGRELSSVCDYLFGWGGIDWEIHGDPSIKLSSTAQINKARFDWRSGTTVETALGEVMADVMYRYVVFDGKAHVYEISETTALPTTLGPDRQEGRDPTVVTAFSQEPNFDNLRNYICVMGVSSLMKGTDTDLSPRVFKPMTQLARKNTTPEIGWDKVIAQGVPGFVTQELLEKYIDKLSGLSKSYELLGRVTFAGDARIKPYDRFGDYVIFSVSHQIDMQSKTWTTSIELQANK